MPLRMRRATVQLPALVGCLGLSSLGCAATPRHAFREPKVLLDRLLDTTSCSRAISGDAGISLSGAGRRLKGSMLFLAEHPDHLRFDVYSPFGVTLSTLATDGRLFSLLNLEDRSFTTGRPGICSVRSFTQVPAPPNAFVELLRGRPPLLAGFSEAAELRLMRSLFGGARYQVSWASTHGYRETILVGVHPDDYAAELTEQRLRLLRVQIEHEDELLYQVDLGAHRSTESAPIVRTAEEIAFELPAPLPSGPACRAETPRDIVFFVAETEQTLGVSVEEVAHNPPLSEDAFVQSVPSGVTRYTSSCDSR